MIYTRKQAHDYMWEQNDLNPNIRWGPHATIRNLITKLIDSIYTSTDQQICPNCAHDYCGCSVQDSILQVDPEATFDTFGCNSFEAASKLTNPTNFDEAIPKSYDNPFKDL